ncbi:MAG TPA: hypothetical protein DDW33_05110, partial [Ktedonobacter sp.]|nr:hypothetical protein [Ktedonobacter sp.]HBE25050.1 hypothetical protein [Ktedonobacter sp.]
MLLFVQIPTLTRTILIVLITTVTLIGIMVRPWKLNEAVTTMTGASLLLILGLISPYDAFSTLVHDWN